MDCRLRPGQINTEMLAVLEALEPIGAGNPRPLFGLVRMTLERVEPLSGGKHLRLTLSRDGARITAVKFSTPPESFPYAIGEVLDLAVTLDRNEYRGVVSVSIVVKDVRHTDLDQEEMLEALAQYDGVLRRESADSAAVRMPEREQLARVYRFIKQRPYNGPIEVLCRHLRAETTTCTDVLIACRILREAGLIEWRDEGETVYAAVKESSGKADLTQTATAKFLLQGEV